MRALPDRCATPPLDRAAASVKGASMGKVRVRQPGRAFMGRSADGRSEVAFYSAARGRVLGVCCLLLCWLGACQPAGQSAVVIERVQLQAANVAIERGDLEGALPIMQKVAEQSPTAKRWALVARLQLALGSLEAGLSTLQTAVEAFPGEPELMVLYGDTLAALGERERAEEQYHAALLMSPRNVDSWLRVAALTNTVDECQSANRWLRDVPADERTGEVLLVRAELAKCNGSTRRMRELQAEAAQRDDFQVERSLAIARLYLLKTPPALSAAEPLLTRATTSPAAGGALFVLHANVCVDLGNLDCAEDALRTVANGGDLLAREILLRPAVTLLQARIAVERGSWAPAIVSLRRILPFLNREQTSVAQAYLTQAYVGLGMIDEALAARAEVSESSPAYERAQLSLVDHYANAQEFRAAAGTLEMLLAYRPRSVAGYLRLAQVRVQEGRPNQVLGVLQRGLRLVPSAAPLWVALGEHQMSADPARGQASLERAVQLDPVDPAALSALAARYMELDEPQRAFALYEDALPRSLNPAPLQRALAALYAQVGRRLPRALRLAQASLDLQPESAEGEATLAQVLYRLGKPAAALPHMEAAVAADPGNPRYLTELGLIAAAGDQQVVRPTPSATVVAASP